MYRIIALVFLIFSDNVLAIQLQERDSWSWASSVQYVLSEAGMNQSQTEVAAKIPDLSRSKSARVDEVVTLVSSYGLKASKADRPNSSQDLYNSVAAGWRVIAFVRQTKGPQGHFIVLQGSDQNGNITISDPWTGLTYTQSAQNLYDKWRWADSVIVDR
jgi:hypothetical protein